MANKHNFKPEEWTKILESAMLAAMAVSAAEPSGLLGALKEAVASSSTLAKAKSDAGANELVKAVVSDFETKDGRAAVQEALRQQLDGAKKPGDVVERSFANLKEVSAILNAKAPQDAAGFKAWLQTISKNVAEASSGGRFSWHRRRESQRCRKGDACRHIEGPGNERLTSDHAGSRDHVGKSGDIAGLPKDP